MQFVNRTNRVRQVKARQIVSMSMLIGASVLYQCADASPRICNRTAKEISVAVMYKSDTGWITEGWFPYAPNQCGSPKTQSIAPNTAFYVYGRRDDVSWSGKEESSRTGCTQSSSWTKDADNCESERKVSFFRINGGAEGIVKFTRAGETLDFSQEENLAKACAALTRTLDRPRMRSEKVVLARYTDVLTPPQTRTQCTNVYDTGVPDPSTCTTKTDSCASKWRGPFGSWGCVPGVATTCSNIKACNTWRTDKKTMQCDLTFQLKLPNFIERPLEDFVDNSYSVIESTRNRVATSLPLACAPGASSATAASQAVIDQITQELTQKVRGAIEREARQWLQETAIQTVVASIPSGGIGGGAVMSTQLGTFVIRTKKAIEPIIRVANDAKDYAEDVGFGTSCGWSDWSRL